jgi:hypothetical protein
MQEWIKFPVRWVRMVVLLNFHFLFSSMFFDEDGDLAHEFYIEVPPSRKGCKATMKKVLHNLVPQVRTTPRSRFCMEC